MMLRDMTPQQIEKAKGKLATFSLVRDGVAVERSGPLGRVTPTIIWVGAYCYSLAEVIETLRIEEAV